MYYVYMLKSVGFEDRYYTGFTEDIEKRLDCHNAGSVSHTSKYRPWKILSYVVFDDKQKAYDFERYLKSHSGRAFAAKHF